jgi:hypothetical protein
LTQSDDEFTQLLEREGVRGDPLPVAMRARFALYRELVHARFRGALEVSIPHTLARLPDEVASAMVGRFIQEHASRSPYLRDVARELVEWATPIWRKQPGLGPYLGDLARFELLFFEVGAAPDDPPRHATPVAADAPVPVQAAARLEHFEFAVHLLANQDAVDPSRDAEARSSWVLAYRDGSRRTRFVELTPFGAALFTRLQAGLALGAAATGACEDTNQTMGDEVLADAAVLLEDLERRGVLLTQEGQG